MLKTIIKKITPVIISLPIFIISGIDFDISLIGQENNPLGIVFPVSLVFFCILMLAKILDRKIQLLLFIILIHASIINVAGLNYLGLSIWIYFLAYFTFCSIFASEPREFQIKIMANIVKTLAIVQVSVLVSSLIFDLGYGSLLNDAIVVYNYAQYFAISMALGLAIQIEISKNKFHTMGFALIAILGAIHSENSTAVALIVIILFFSIFLEFFELGKSLRVALVLIISIIPVITPFFVGVMMSVLNIDKSESELILNGRGAIWADYVNIISFENLFNNYSFTRDVERLSLPSVHNIFLNYFFTLTPIIGSILYVYLIISIIRIESRKIKFCALLVASLAGVNLELITHPYFAIQFALVTAILRVEKSYKQVRSNLFKSSLV